VGIEGTKRGELLRKAAALTEGDRNHTHGDAVEQQDLAGRLFSAWIAEAQKARVRRQDGRDYTAHDTAMFVMFVKASRAACGAPNLDNYVDGPAYWAIAGEALPE
jgi:hypothetical protein